MIELPPDIGFRDIAATFRAVEGEWTTVNGYSGYLPNYYYALRDAVREETNDVLVPFQRARELHVLVPVDAPRLMALVEGQPGVVLTGRNAAIVQYRLPRRPVVERPQGPERRLPVASLHSECAPLQLPFTIDEDEDTIWECAAEPDQRVLTVDLGEIRDVGSIVHSVGVHSWLAPARLSLDTSEDAVRWRDAWSGNPMEEAFVASLADPRRLRIAIRFPQRRARYLRVRGVAIESGVPWTIAELEVWSGTAPGEQAP